MKKQLCKLAIFALLLSTASCSDEQFAGDLTGGETTVTFNAQLPAGLQTRTAGDGMTATTLSYAVYEQGETTPVITSEDEVKFVNGQATLSLKLAKGKTYDFLFWADSYEKDDAENPYNVDFATQTLTVDYTDAKSNDEARDAFFGTEKVAVKGAVSQNITLKRPFAQLNIGTNDMAAAQTAGLKTDALQSSVKVSGIFSSMNLMTGIPDPSTSTEVTFGLNDIPDESFMVDGKTFHYLALNYLLVSDQKGLVNCEFTYTDGATTETRTIDNVPVQRNYRTNIFGSLLTGSVDLGITIDPNFDGADYGVAAPWDGKTVTEPKQTDTDILISSPAEWVWLKTHNRNGKNIKLTANLDFGGFEVKGIGAPAVFDGQGYIMSNMVLLPGGSYYSNGLFQGDATFGDVTVKNVTFENITAECSDPEQGYVGVVFGDLQNNGNLTLENVHVKDADLCGVQSVGGLVGFVASGRTVSINNCSVEGGYFHNYPVADESGFVAGLVGRPVGTVNVTASEVKDTDIDGYYVTRRGASSIAEVIGGQETVDGVTVTNVTVKKTLIDAVASTTEELIAALAENKENIVLKAGEYELGGATFGASKVNIVGDDREKSVVKVSKSIYADGKTINLKNLTYSVPAGLTYNEFDFAFIHRAAEFNMEGCVIADGRLRINVSKSLIKNCQFNVSTSNGFDGYALFYYGNNDSEVTVNNCTFDTAGKAIVVYSEGARVYNLDVNDCVFTSDASTDKAAIQMHTEHGISGTLDITNSKATGFADVHNGLWNELNNSSKEPTTKFDVTVDGVKVQ